MKETKSNPRTKRPPTPQPKPIKEKKVSFKDICPNCGSDKLDYDFMEPDGEELFQDVGCDKCGFEFTIYSPIREWFITELKL